MALDEMIAAELGMTAEQLQAERAAKHDAEVEGFIRLMRGPVEGRLLGADWVERYEGADGLGCWDKPSKGLRLIHSVAREDDGHVWSHLSVSRRDRVLPTWEQLRDVGWLVHPDTPGVVVLATRDEHYSHPKAEVAHAWFCLTRRVVPDFRGSAGTI